MHDPQNPEAPAMAAVPDLLQLFADDAEIADEPPPGPFGRVYVLRSEKKKEKSVLKRIPKGSASYAEVSLLRDVDHLCLLRVTSVARQGAGWWLVAEHAAGGNLRDWLKQHGPLSLTQAKLLLYQLAHAVYFLHENDICFANVKPTNVLLTRRRLPAIVKLSDFGLRRRMRPGAGEEVAYLPPELRAPCDGSGLWVRLRGWLSRRGLGRRVDVWALGVLLFQALTNSLPPPQAPLDPPHELPEPAAQLMRQMLQETPQERASLESVLESSWLEDDRMMQTFMNLIEE